jgi:hypothetical protein
MNPFKTYYAQEIYIWLKAHQGHVIMQYHTATLLIKAYAGSVAMEVAVDGFRKTRSFPLQPNILRDHNFATNTEDIDSGFGVKRTFSIVWFAI